MEKIIEILLNYIKEQLLDVEDKNLICCLGEILGENIGEKLSKKW